VKNKKLTLAFLMVGLTLMSMTFVGCASAVEELPGIPTVTKAHGFAVARVGENETVRVPAHMALRGRLLKPIQVENRTVGHLVIRDGILVIGEAKYNITRGRGDLVLESHKIFLRANVTSSSGESGFMRVQGKWLRAPDGTVLLMNMTGSLKFETEGKMLFLRGAVFPKPQETT
jgi:hypothetical protein